MDLKTTNWDNLSYSEKLSYGDLPAVDCSFEIGEGTTAKTIGGHKSVLASASTVFESMFSGNYKEADASFNIPLPNVLDHNDFEVILKYIYYKKTDSIEFLSLERLKHVAYLADYYMLDELLNACHIEIEKKVGRTHTSFYDFLHIFEYEKKLGRTISTFQCNGLSYDYSKIAVGSKQATNSLPNSTNVASKSTDGIKCTTTTTFNSNPALPRISADLVRFSENLPPTFQVLPFGAPAVGDTRFASSNSSGSIFGNPSATKASTFTAGLDLQQPKLETTFPYTSVEILATTSIYDLEPVYFYELLKVLAATITESGRFCLIENYAKIHGLKMEKLAFHNIHKSDNTVNDVNSKTPIARKTLREMFELIDFMKMTVNEFKNGPAVSKIWVASPEEKFQLLIALK